MRHPLTAHSMRRRSVLPTRPTCTWLRGSTTSSELTTRRNTAGSPPGPFSPRWCRPSSTIHWRPPASMSSTFSAVMRPIGCGTGRPGQTRSAILPRRRSTSSMRWLPASRRRSSTSRLWSPRTSSRSWASPRVTSFTASCRQTSSSGNGPYRTGPITARRSAASTSADPRRTPAEESRESPAITRRARSARTGDASRLVRTILAAVFGLPLRGSMNASRETVWARGEAERRARIDLAACHRLAARFGFNEGIDNHLTMLVPGHTDRFYLAPFGLLWSEVRASDLMELNFQGQVVAGRGLVEDTALYIHLSLHRLRPQARCVLHTHMPYATALGTLEDPRLLMSVQSAIGFHDEIAYVDYNGLALDYSEGERLARAMGGKPVALLRNHGALVIGESAAQAFERLYFLER